MSFTQTTSYTTPAAIDMDVSMSSDSTSSGSTNVPLGGLGDTSMASAMDLDVGGTAADSDDEGNGNAGTSGSGSGRCTHVAEAFVVEAARQAMLKKFKAAVAWGASMSGSHARPAKRRKLQTPACGTCGLTLHRPFICLQCPYGGCWKDDHILGHLKDSGHQFCADVKSGSVYCIECDDFILNSTFDDLYHSTTLHEEEKETQFISAKKERREPYKPWHPDAKESNFAPVSCSGRIGLLNLGQTCFLNVVLQSLLNNPLLRNYFLSDKHNYKLCKNTDCMCCEMDKLFTEVYSGKSSAYGPSSLLATTWRASSELAGYAQQDAHEFFMSALNQLHKGSPGNTSVSCNCPVHEIFGGALQSETTCDKCGTVSRKSEPILDISLQLKGKGPPGADDNTLVGCLRRYTHPESLKCSCSECGNTMQSTTKRLSIRKLPPVLCFQFKRFEHDGQNGKATPKKIDAHIRFPASLNMLPFTTLVLNSRSSSEKEPYLGPDSLYDYDLFAVIVHDGQIDNGHYTNFARSQDEWYRYDDDKVTRSSLEAALRSSAYMCFYVKRHLDYRPFTQPSYKLARETEAVKEKEKEREKEAARMKEVEDILLATI